MIIKRKNNLSNMCSRIKEEVQIHPLLKNKRVAIRPIIMMVVEEEMTMVVVIIKMMAVIKMMMEITLRFHKIIMEVIMEVIM